MLQLGKGMSYMPGAASLAATHRGKVELLSTLRDDQTQVPKSCILNFEKETETYDAATKQETRCKR